MNPNEMANFYSKVDQQKLVRRLVLINKNSGWDFGAVNKNFLRDLKAGLFQNYLEKSLMKRIIGLLFLPDRKLVPLAVA